MESIKSEKFQLNNNEMKSISGGLGARWEMHVSKTGTSRFSQYNFWGNLVNSGLDTSNGSAGAYSGSGWIGRN